MKKLLFCLLILFLSGCSLNYRLEINEDNNFNEIVSFSDKNSNLMKQNEDLDVAFDLLKDYYKNHEGIYPGVNVPKKFKRINDGDTSFASLLMKKKSLTELDNSLYLNRFFNLIELNNNSNIVSLYFYDFNYEKLENMLNEKNININDVNLRIKCIYEVEYSNHDYYDENNNEYVWNLDSNDDVIINLEFEKDKYTYEALPIKKNRRLNQIKLVKRNKYFMDVTENYQEEWKNAAVSMRIINKNKKALRKIRNNYSVSNLYITNTGELHLMDFDELIKKNYISELDEPVKFIKRNIVTRVIKRKTKKLRKIKNLSKDEIYRKLYVKYAKKVKKGK